jgi:DNA-directed RNA polymerase specialized sigma24 family protein
MKGDMDNPSVSRTEWTLTEEAFAKFLACLDPDKDRAGETYEILRLMLVKFFDWRGAHFPEECVDETIDRVARKIDCGEVVRDIRTYCHGVARMILLEARRHPDNKRTSLDELIAVDLASPAPEEPDLRLQCFERCLNELPIESRLLIMEYYRDEGRGRIDNRQSLAEKLGIPIDALRSRAQRLRNRLEKCVNRCTKRRL